VKGEGENERGNGGTRKEREEIIYEVRRGNRNKKEHQSTKRQIAPKSPRNDKRTEKREERRVLWEPNKGFST